MDSNGHTVTNVEAPAGKMKLEGSSNNRLRNVRLATLDFQFNGSTVDNRIEDSSISSVTKGSTVMSNQAWVNNREMPVGYKQSGQVSLVAGTTTIASNIVKAGSVIRVSRFSAGGVMGHLSVGTIIDGVSFVINSTDVGDTSEVVWEILDL